MRNSGGVTRPVAAHHRAYFAPVKRVRRTHRGKFSGGAAYAARRQSLLILSYQNCAFPVARTARAHAARHAFTLSTARPRWCYSRIARRGQRSARDMMVSTFCQSIISGDCRDEAAGISSSGTGTAGWLAAAATVLAGWQHMLHMQQ